MINFTLSCFREFLIYLHKDTKIIDKDLTLVEVDDKMSRNVERPSGLDFYVGYVHGLIIYQFKGASVSDVVMGWKS